MIGGAPTGLLITQADSARAVASVYTVSLLATIPLVLAALGVVVLRRSTAEARGLVLRSTIVALLVVFIGRQLPLHWIAWVVPSALAGPLVALGRVQVTSTSMASAHGDPWFSATVVRSLFVFYIAGVAIVLLPTMVALARARVRLQRAFRVSGGSWEAACAAARTELGIVRPVRLFVDPTAKVPMTWGFIRPVVVLPPAARSWSVEQLRIVLLHELAHVRASDWAFNLVGRLVCALYWFHPGAWWAARTLRDECEVACDDRVIAAGVRRSDYADLLVRAADALVPVRAIECPALTLSRRRGLRGRLAAILDLRHDVRPLRRGWATVASVATFLVAGPVSAVQLAPTRDVLTTLMRDARWESRAYAVLGLAQRPDSIAVARDAAELDPNPRVRAWARYALGQRADTSELRAVLPDR